jgi:outer membrane protein assembly factor BamD (BamD/ComL family)
MTVDTLRGMFTCAYIVLLAACSSADADWKTADAAGTIAGYQSFLKDHPNDERDVKARERIQVLEDQQAWADAQKADTVDAVQQYLQKQPKGAHVSEAHDQVTALQRAAAWKVAQADGKEAALKDFLQKYSQGPEADQARAKLQELEAYRVQLASFRSKKQAEADSKRLQTRYGKILHEVVVVSTPKKLNYVSSEPMTLADAQSACGALKNEHQHCEIVKR